MPHILLIGGHGKIAQLLTPLLLAKSWSVTSLIRAQEQVSAIEKLGAGKPGKLSVLVDSIEEVKSEADAKGVIEKAGTNEQIDWVVWSAGAGGRGGPSRTLAVDRDAAIAFTRASIANPHITKFLTVSYIASRRNRPSWWTDADWESAQNVNNNVLPTYFQAKVAADEVLTAGAKLRYDEEAKKGVEEGKRFHGISLRPGQLTDEPAGGVTIGKVPSRGTTSRASVAEVVAKVLETPGAKGWLDVLDGDDSVDAAVEKAVKEGIDSVEGEDLAAQKERAGL
ncbi:uncharacterized protein BDZ99DRAFT_459289 [Mytilinidion resinicola]|uniref:NAD(P)-binding domain-containing protein n=1 Tax=Mytilinidion resinicola TaxID=574789 RepID=A0A6A6Z3M7_9PEZI|nr:uncharacterized protein BDZ99DRAFT_459289 [Mytilinidion resinicola]KAF2815418.1 hypothetical protein BDZ99DRAFT_459289 [Mytilinidion resinicola]